MENEELFCRLCLNATNIASSTAIEGNIKDVLKFLLSKLGFEKIEKQVLCNTCSTKVLAAYNFKATCMETEDKIFPYVTSKLLDLREIFSMTKGYTQINNMLDDENVCRLCIQLLSCEFISFTEMDIDMIRVYIPEVNFNLTKDPVICETCFKALIIHSSFLRTCLDMYEKIEYTPDCSVSIKTEEVDIKPEQNNSSSGGIAKDSDNNGYVIQLEPSLKAQTYNCDICPFESKYRRSLKLHELKHKDPAEVQMYKCYKCDYQTKIKNNIVYHQIKHSSEGQMYKCAVCDFQTKRKSCLKQHHLTHKDRSEVQMYRCDTCGFETKQKHNLKRHVLIHKNPSEADIHVHNCNECDYKTIHKHLLKSHELKHKDPSEVQMHKCDECEYETKHKRALRMHQLRHKNPSEVRMFKCEKCNYESKRKGNLANHELMHERATEPTLHKCGQCKFETKYRSYLKAHQQERHKSKSPGQSGNMGS